MYKIGLIRLLLRRYETRVLDLLHKDDNYCLPDAIKEDSRDQIRLDQIRHQLSAAARPGSGEPGCQDYVGSTEPLPHLMATSLASLLSRQLSRGHLSLSNSSCQPGPGRNHHSLTFDLHLMPGPLRNSRGCWTCRVRKKKCDECRDQCSTCTSLSITCYGYGPRPEWVDNGERERAMKESFKETVKHASRSKVKTRLSRPIIKIAPKSLHDSVDNPSSSAASSSQPAPTPASNQEPSQEDRNAILKNEATVSKLVS